MDNGSAYPDGNGNGNGNGAHVAETVDELKPKRKHPEFDMRLLSPQGLGSQEITFPGHDGLPFRGPIPQLKEDDPSEKRPQIGCQLYVDVLDLSDAEDLEHYRNVCQMVGNGYAQISYEDRRYDEVSKNWRVLVRWFLNYAYVPK